MRSNPPPSQPPNLAELPAEHGSPSLGTRANLDQPNRVERSFSTKVWLPTDREREKTTQNYLALVDRPVRALLRSEATQQLAAGEYLYHSRPFRLGPWQVVPRIHLQARQRGQMLWIKCRASSQRCLETISHKNSKLTYAYGLDVYLLAQGDGIEARGLLWLESVSLSLLWAQPLSGLIMIELNRRLQRRFQSGLQKDFARWLNDGRIVSV
jgi:hypothetical protein